MDTPRQGRTLIPRPRTPRKQGDARKLAKGGPAFVRQWLPVGGAALALAIALFSLPSVLATDLKNDTETKAVARSFPVTVDPERRTIVEDPAIEELLAVEPTSLAAATGVLTFVYEQLAIVISDSGWYRQIAGIGGINNLFVTVYPGQRAEEVANSFGYKLKWTPVQKATFLKEIRALDPELNEGKFVPGTHFISVTTPEDAAVLAHNRFETEILERYGTTTSDRVPLEDALIIASLIEREAAGWEDMRLISGVIWNRIFVGMNLQIDATMQYSKASLAGGEGGWWPQPVPADKNIRHPYNTYRRAGLPPGPIANPSIAAIVAALNPKKTDCLFYFHDARGQFHCSPTYEGHVTLLKKYYGQGR